MQSQLINSVCAMLLVLFSICDSSLAWNPWSKNTKNDSFVSEWLRIPFTTEFVGEMNYPAETVTVITKDNYVLGLHRLPQKAPTDKVVLIQHGMMSSSVDWVLIGRDKSIALILHDLGYDVWLGNSRGNSYSRSHRNRRTDSKEYWNFSWHEIGYYDLPAIVDTILQRTNVNRIDYIGHSQGTTTFLVMAALLPRYQKYFRTVIGMSPIAFLSNIPNNYMRLVASNVEILEPMLDRLKIYEVTPSNGFRATLTNILCKETSPAHEICANLLFLTVGPGPTYLNKTILPNIFHNIHAGVSTRQLLHYANLINSGRFQHYDHRQQNMAVYNNAVPPDYPLQAIAGMHFHLYYGTKDTLMAKRDVHRLEDNLRYTNSVHVTELADFNHLDYIFGNNVTDILYRPVMEVMLNRLEEEREEDHDE